VFFITNATGIALFHGTKVVKAQYIEELDDVFYGNECWQHSTTLCMNGVDLIIHCMNKPCGISYDVCAPDSLM
jgi:hypothetical protein